jgi:hypothetical protein
LLLPGLVSSQIFYSILGQGKEVSASTRIYDAIIFSFISYLAVSMITPWSPILQVHETQGTLNYAFSGDRALVFYNLLTMIFIPILLAGVMHNDLFHKVLRLLRVSSKTSRQNTWSDVLLAEDRFIVVYLKDERRIRGYPTKFSADPQEGYIYLFNPAWVNDERQKEGDPAYIEIGAHGILVNKSEIDLIEFALNPGEKPGPHDRRS